MASCVSSSWLPAAAKHCARGSIAPRGPPAHLRCYEAGYDYARCSVPARLPRVSVGVHGPSSRLFDRRGAAITGGHHRRLLGTEDRDQPDGLDPARAPEVPGVGPVRQPADDRGGGIHAVQTPRSRAGTTDQRPDREVDRRRRQPARRRRARDPHFRKSAGSRSGLPRSDRQPSAARRRHQSGRCAGRRLRARQEDVHLRSPGAEDRPDQPLSAHRRRTLLETGEVLPRRARQRRLSAAGSSTPSIAPTHRTICRSSSSGKPSATPSGPRTSTYRWPTSPR